MTGLAQDFRYALRQLRRSPAFAAVATVTLALAIGANTAIFSVVNAVLLAPLPYRQVDRLMMIWEANRTRGEKAFPISPGDFTSWKQENDVFEDIAASYDNEVTLTGSGDPKLVIGYAFTPNYFRILDVAPQMGRTFTEQEAQSKAPVVVLSDKFWRTTLHGDAQVLGKAISLDAKPYTVIGVMPPTFNYPSQTELWMPISLSADSGDYDRRYLRIIGRLKPGISVEEAQVRMDALERRIAALHPATEAGNETWVEPIRHQLSGDIRKPLLVLLGAVAIVLLIACVNIAGLLLARAAGRRAEVSLRTAMGASRFRLVRQFLIESLLLSLPGGLLGVGLAFWCTRFLVAIFPNNVANLSIPKVESIPLNAPVLWFALGITVLSSVFLGVLPALQSSRSNESDALKESGRVLGSGAPSARTRRILTSAEIALSLVLLSGAGLMIDSFRQVYRQDLGFQPDHVLGLEIFLPRNRYPSEQPQTRLSFVSGVLANLKELPGVQSVAATNYLPLTGFWGTTDFVIQGRTPVNESQKPTADSRLVTPGYFSSMGITLLQGRDFTDSDRLGSEQVAIMNSTLAHRYFGNEDPVGKIVELEGDDAPVKRWRVVGVVSDVRAFGPEEAAHADLYRPLAQVTFPLLGFVVRSTGDPAMLLKSAQQAVWRVDKDQPIFDSMPLSLLAAQSLTLRRTSTMVLASFAILALLLAALGLYGVMSYSVSQRTHEFGIRMALGARRQDVLQLVLRSGIGLVLVGEAIGLAAALLLARLSSSLLFGVSPDDPWTLATALAVLTLVAVVASYIPASRATRVDPMVALRYE
ncbi:MAG TPA: ABC transporter permease [Candidatus Sulfotelmatobacter sp.]|nr:ABC transporter permease [Candidatus Sulfotelmatobacter sp.]